MGYCVDIYFKIREIDTEKLLKKIVEELKKSIPDVVIEKRRFRGPYAIHTSYWIKKEGLYEFGIFLKTRKTNPYHQPPIPKGYLYLILSAGLFHFDTYGYSDKEEIEKRKKVEKITKEFLKCAKIIYYIVKPEAGAGDHELTLEHYNYDLENRIYWINFFLPERVKKIGKEKFLTAPAYKVEELKDGGILLIATKEQGMAGPEITEKIAKHLGLMENEQ